MPDVPSREEFEALEAKLNKALYEIEKLVNWPLLLNWVSPAIASKFLNKDLDTLKRMRERGDIQYSKDVKKVEYYLPSLIAYRERTHIRKDVIIDQLKKLKNDKS